MTAAPPPPSELLLRPLLLPTDASFQAYEGFVPTCPAQAWVRAEVSCTKDRKKKRPRADGGDEAAAAPPTTAEPRSMASVVVMAAASSQQQQQQQGHAVARELAALTGAPFICAEGGGGGVAAAPPPAAAAADVAAPPSFPPPPLRFLAALARQMDEAGAWPLLSRAPGPDKDDVVGGDQAKPVVAGRPSAPVSSAPSSWRLDLALRDRRGRAHAARVRLDPRAFPAAPPFLARPLDLPLVASAAGGAAQDGGGGGGGGAATATAAATTAPARTLAQLVAHARASVAACEPIWDALDDLDAHCWVLDPPSPAGGGGGGGGGGSGGGGSGAEPPPLPRGGLCCRYRRIALGGHASLHVELAPAAVVGAGATTTTATAPLPLPPPPRVSVLGGGAAVAELQRRWAAFDAARGWARCEGRVRPWLEAGLGVRLPPPPSVAGAQEEEDGGGAMAAADDEAAASPKLLPNRVEADCAICFAYLLPAEAGAGAPEEVPTIACARGSGGGDANAAAAAACARAPGCGRAFHRRCISEWLQALPSTSRCFGGLRGECPYCGAEVEVAGE